MSDEKNLPTLFELLAKRGVVRTGERNDYDEYIKKKEEEIKPSLFGNSLISEGSMHLALGQTISVRKFKY